MDRELIHLDFGCCLLTSRSSSRPAATVGAAPVVSGGNPGRCRPLLSAGVGRIDIDARMETYPHC